MTQDTLDKLRMSTTTSLPLSRGQTTAQTLKFRFIDLLKDEVSPVILKVIIEGAIKQASLLPDSPLNDAAVDGLIRDICRRLNLFVKQEHAGACIQRLIGESGRTAQPLSTVSERELLIRSENDVIRARRDVAQFVEDCMCSNVQSVRTATIVSELARNIHQYAKTGTIRIRVAGGQIEIIAIDQGPGISDVDSVLAGTFQTARGMARGLFGVKKLARDLRIISKPGQGTMVAVQLKS